MITAKQHEAMMTLVKLLLDDERSTVNIDIQHPVQAFEMLSGPPIATFGGRIKLEITGVMPTEGFPLALLRLGDQ